MRHANSCCVGVGEGGRGVAAAGGAGLPLFCCVPLQSGRGGPRLSLPSGFTLGCLGLPQCGPEMPGAAGFLFAGRLVPQSGLSGRKALFLLTDLFIPVDVIGVVETVDPIFVSWAFRAVQM